MHRIACLIALAALAAAADVNSDLLDAAALRIFQGARAPAFPAAMTQLQLTITTSIRFRLEP